MMKKMFLMMAWAMLTMTACAQKSEPAKKMSRNELMEALSPLIEQLQTVTESDDSVRVFAEAFALKNQNDAGLYVVCNLLSQVSKPEQLKGFVAANDFYAKSDEVKKMLETLSLQEATAEGKMFVDFAAEYEGKVSKLSDYVGKGKYVLVDFWASWCGPCKAEVPNLIKVHEKYKGDRFTVLGVATWDKPEATLQAISQLGITYPQIMNAQQAGSDAYGIQGIPQIILFGPDGTILKRDLRGDMIEKTVAKYLSE